LPELQATSNSATWPSDTTNLVPGCQFDVWMSNYAVPERAVAPEEQVWSNVIDPTAAAKLLEHDH
jgi:hypothetical protein